MDPLEQIGVHGYPASAGPSPDTSASTPDPQPPIGYGQTPDQPITQVSGFVPAARTQARRDVFWSNVVREILMSLSSAAAHASGRLSTGPAGANASSTPVGELFDGRMGVITTLGQRIPIADIIPVFACSMPGCEEDRARSNDVQCTVFKINTPTGESFTLPISQIIGVHSLSDGLMDQLEQTGGDHEPKERIPFGFGAYTALAQSESEDTDSDSE